MDRTHHFHSCICQDLSNEPPMQDVVASINVYLSSFLQTPDTIGILVAHNGNTTDFQFLAAGFIRSDVQLDPRISLTLDTLHTMRRFKSNAYYTAKREEWTVFTATGKISLSIDATVTFTLMKGGVSGTFETECGEHHDPAADTKGLRVILWDFDSHGKKVQH